MVDTLSYSDDVPGRNPTRVAEYQRRFRATESGRARTRRYATSPKGRATAQRAEKKRSDCDYLTRPFLAWDGEGITDAFGIHRYVLLANSERKSIINPDGLSSAAIFEFLLATKEAHPDAIHIVYGGGYDFNFWMRSLSRDDVERIYRTPGNEGVRVGEYRICWRPGKFFRVSKGSRSVTVSDVLSFFQRKFTTSLDEYFGETWKGRDEIYAGKARRSAFRIDELDSIRDYNDLELSNLVALMVELRRRLDLVGLRPGRWDGPGGIAAALLTQKGIKDAKSDPSRIPSAVSRAIRCAYAGGRFEMLRFGTVNAPAFEYDINSAYPHALQHVPCLAHGQWVRHDGDPGSREFALYHVRYRGPQDAKPAPLFHRDDRGAIAYPGTVSGWYWTPEVDSLRDYVAETKRGKYTIVECWEWQVDSEGCQEAGHSTHPFDWIPGYYRKRQALKKAGDGAHVGIKLALNSLYGKLAQQVGWRIDRKGNLRIPPFHELAWAGFVTSTCRSMVLRAAMHDLDAIIAFETDALFSSRPLHLPLGNALGDWEVTEFSSLAYCQSGTYFGTVDGKAITRTRGVDLGTVTREDFEAALREPVAANQRIPAKLTRFIGAGLALQTKWVDWCQWVTSPKSIWAGPPETSKRIHQGCRHCFTARERRSGASGIRPEVWHETVCMRDERFPYSAEYPVAWVPESGDMPELAELRLGAYEEWDGVE